MDEEEITDKFRELGADVKVVEEFEDTYSVYNNEYTKDVSALADRIRKEVSDLNVVDVKPRISSMIIEVNDN